MYIGSWDFLSVRCVVVEVCSPGCVCWWRMTPWRCQQANNPCWYDVWREVVVQAVPVGRYQVVYCVAVNM